MSIKQRESVYLATLNVLADNTINFDDGQARGVEPLVTKAMRASIISIVTASILSGETEMSTEARAKYHDEKTMKGYVNGLVSNWHRKDPKLNGNVKHEIKSPGSRAGAGDEVIKALTALKVAKADDPEALTLINAKIAERKAELGTSKKVPEVTEAMLALIPADLKAKLGL